MTQSSAERRAARQAALYGRTAAERVELLAMLGLLPQQKPKRGRPPGSPDHGTPARYGQGCRCPECRAANTRLCAERARRRAADPAAADRAGHGKASTYQNYACRCPACTQAHSAKCLAYKQRRKADTR
ncbi:hypothetical protein ACFWNK_01980 [Streptomyces sp. NPDC058417]|uniref:hypothetical protein n=1 Tax=unclassified Streptomyces TaxID=2593676 RepID=UPI00365AC4A7